MNKFYENAAKPEVALDFLIRSGTEADLEDMALVTERAYAKREGKPQPYILSPNSDDYKELGERFNYDGFWSILALDGDKLAGFVAGYPGTWKSEDDGSNSEYIYLLMVDPEYQSKGLGKSLLRNAAAVTKKMVGKP